MRTRTITAAAAAAGMAVLLAACGSSTKTTAPTVRPAVVATTDPNAAVIAQAQRNASNAQTAQAALTAQVGAHADQFGALVMPDRSEPGQTCNLVVLSGTAQIQAYKNAGDPVVSNPTGTVGVKVVCDTRSEVANLDAVASVLKTL